MKERVQKLLAEANIASRRAAEDMIARGRVRVNGAIIQLGDKADKATDVIEVDGARVHFDETPKRYIALYKPMQTLSTTQPHADDDRDTIYDFVPFKDERLFSIGRLDADSEGLIVLTNDGELAERLSHPRFNHTKTYRVTVIGLPTVETLDRWQHGIELEDGMTAPCSVKITKGNPRESTLRITMTEGKKRQIRRVASALGYPVRRLIRTHIGMLSGENMKPGEWRELNKSEVEALQTPMPEVKALRGMRAGDPTSGVSFRPRQYQRTDRGDSAGGRPRRESSGDRPYRPRRDGDSSERPRRESSGDRPYRPRRDGDSSARPRRESGERVEAPAWRKGADDVIKSWGRDSDSSERPRRDGDSRPPRRESSGDRPYRPRRDGESSSERPRRDGDSRPPRRESSGDRPYRPRRDGESGSDRPRRDGDSRPPRRESSGDRPYRPRRDGESSSERPRRDGDSRPPRRESSGDRPYRPRRDGDSRPPRRDGDSRPPRRESSGDRPYRPRRDGDSRPPRRESSGDRPYRPRRDGESGADRPRRDGDSRPPRRDGDSRPPRRDGDSRPPRRDGEQGSDRPRRDGDSRPPRRDGDSRPPRRDGDSRPPRRESSGDRPYRPRRDGESGLDRPRRDGDSRPPRRDGDSRPPRCDSNQRSDSRPSRANDTNRPAARRKPKDDADE